MGLRVGDPRGRRARQEAAQAGLPAGRRRRAPSRSRWTRTSATTSTCCCRPPSSSSRRSSARRRCCSASCASGSPRPAGSWTCWSRARSSGPPRAPRRARCSCSPTTCPARSRCCAARPARTTTGTRRRRRCAAGRAAGRDRLLRRRRGGRRRTLVRRRPVIAVGRRTRSRVGQHRRSRSSRSSPWSPCSSCSASSAPRSAARTRSLALSRELRHRYDALQAVTKEGVLVQSLTGRVLDISERAAAILGVDAGVLGRAVGRRPARRPASTSMGLAMNPAAVLGHRTGSRARGLRRSTPSSSASRCRAPTRTPGAHGAGVQPAGARPATVTPPRVLTTLVDVTGRREVEAALTRSEMQFRVAMENAPIGMALVDLDWRIVEANAAFAELLGTSVGALRGYRMEDLSTPGQPARRAPRGRPPARRRAAPVLAREALPAGRRPPGVGRARRRARAHAEPARRTTSSCRCATRPSRGCRPRCSRTARCTTR